MNIKTSSWHYRILSHSQKMWCRHNSRWNKLSLCWYFWQVVGAMFKWVGMAIVTVVMGSWILLGFYMIFASWVYLAMEILSLPTDFFDTGLIHSSIMINVVILLVVLFGLVAEGISKLKHSERVVEKQPSLFMSYIRAKKERFCPIIKLED